MAGPLTIPGRLRALSRAVRQRPAINPATAGFLDELRFDPTVAANEYAMRSAALDRHFGRPDQTMAGIEVLPSMADELAAADPGLFGNPAVQRMMRNAEYDQAIGDLSSGDVMEMLHRNDRLNTLARVNAMKRGGEAADLYSIAQQSIRDAGLRNRMASEASADAGQFLDNLGLAGLGVATAGVGGMALNEMLQDGPEEVVPVEREVPVFADDGSIYMEPQDDGYEARDDRWYGSSPPTGRDLYVPASPIDSLDGPAADVYVPPQDEGVVEAMLAEAVGADPQIDISGLEDSPALSPATDADLYEEMHGGPDMYLGKARVPGMTDRQMDQMDMLVARGIPPQRAAAVLRGQAPIGRAELDILSALHDMRMGK